MHVDICLSQPAVTVNVSPVETENGNGCSGNSVVPDQSDTVREMPEFSPEVNAIVPSVHVPDPPGAAIHAQLIAVFVDPAVAENDPV